MKVALTLMTLATMAISGTEAALNFDQFPVLSQNGTVISWAPQVRYLSALARGFI